MNKIRKTKIGERTVKMLVFILLKLCYSKMAERGEGDYERQEKNNNHNHFIDSFFTIIICEM